MNNIKLITEEIRKKLDRFQNLENTEIYECLNEINTQLGKSMIAFNINNDVKYSGNHLNGMNLFHISNMAWSDNCLWVYDNNISDILPLLNSPRLETVWMSNNNIVDIPKEFFIKTNISTMWLNDNPLNTNTINLIERYRSKISIFYDKDKSERSQWWRKSR